MSLTVKHLNGDASFLLTFQPLQQFPPSPDAPSNAFTIVLDPWLDGQSKIFHSKFSVSTFKQPSCIQSLSEIPEPDLVIVSQDKTDHCHEQTLKTLPRSGGKTILLAEPSSSKLIRSWKYFDPSKVATLPKWDERKADTIRRIPLPPLDNGGSPGEITISFITPKLDLTGLHGAICITYRPPTFSSECRSDLPLTPPASPPPSAASSMHMQPLSLTDSSSSRTMSVLFSPHGIPYASLQPFVTSHLINSAALPLTALLHCFDKVSNPWYMGGNICAGLPGGAEIAQNLFARVWISAHDADKDTKGFATIQTTVTKFERETVEDVVSPRSLNFPDMRRPLDTEVVVLKVGEEMHLAAQRRLK